jgi:predicted DsbA family dithiol-disulfide isomerase
MEHLRSKYGPAAVERYGKPGNPLDQAGLKVGIVFNPARRVINTTNAHRLMEYIKQDASKKDGQDALMDLMFKAYFERAEDLNKKDKLLDVAVEFGLDRDAVSKMLDSNDHRQSVMAKDMGYKRGGCSGVPMFVLGGYRFSGAQPAEAFEEIFEEMYEA